MNNPEALVDLAAAGTGIVQTGVGAEIRCRPPGHHPRRMAPPTAGFGAVPPSRHLSPVRVFVEFLSALFARRIAELQAADGGFSDAGSAGAASVADLQLCQARIPGRLRRAERVRAGLLRHSPVVEHHDAGRRSSPWTGGGR